MSLFFRYSTLGSLLLALVCLPAVAAGDILPPGVVAAQPPPYPADATGTAEVVLGLVVEADGSVADVWLDRVETTGEGAFGEAALAYVKALSFTPAMRNGEPLAVEIEYRVFFRQVPRAQPDEAGLLSEAGRALQASEGGSLPASEEPAQQAPAAGLVQSAARAEQPVAGSVMQAARDETAAAEFETSVTDRRVAAPLAASEFAVNPKEFSEVPRRTAEQMLTLVPGILLRNHQGEGHASAIFLRGFDAGEGQDIEILLDGMPLNEVSNPHGHGYADTHFIIPELVTQLRVIEGPFDPAQGDFAVAGSANWKLGLPERGLRLQAGAGSFDEREFLLLWGPEAEAVGTYVGVRLRKGDGFGINRSFSAASAMAGYEHGIGSRSRFRLTGFAHASRFDSAGVVREDAVQAKRLPCAPDDDSQFFCTHDPNQGGAGSRIGMMAQFESRAPNRTFVQQAWLATRSLRLRENFTGLLHDEQKRGDGTEQIYGATTFGLKGAVGFGTDWIGHKQSFEVGYDVRHDDGESILRRLRQQGGDAFERVFDNEFRITHVGAWGGAKLRPTDWLELRGGLRLDTFFFEVMDRNRPDVGRAGPRETSASIAADGLAVQPRLGLRLSLLEGLDWITSFGVGVRSSDAAALADGEFAPFARVRAAETGWVLSSSGELPAELRLVGFLTHVDRDLVFDERLSRNVFLGSSNRYGALLAARMQAGSWLDAQGSLTWTEAHLTAEDSGFFSFGEGARLPYVPRWVGRLDAAVRKELQIAEQVFPARAGIGLTWVGARPLPLEQFGDPYATVDLGAHLAWGRFELGLNVLNLFDARYHQAEFHYASHFGAPNAPPSRVPALHFAAAPPLTFFATLSVVLDIDSGSDVRSEVESP